MKEKLIRYIFIFATVFVSRTSAQLSTFYSQDFEGNVFPPSGWQTVNVSDPAYGWEKSSLRPYTGDYSAYIHPSTENVPGEDWLISPQFSVASGDLFSFWLATSGVDFYPDSTFIMVSTTDASPSSFTNVLATLEEGSDYPSSSYTYQFYSYSLSAFAGQDIYIAIVNKNTYGDGVFIDDVEIGNPVILSASSESINVPGALAIGTTITPSAFVKNNASTPQSFPVTLISSGGYSSTKNVTSLAPGTEAQVTFDPWTASANDSAVELITQLAGDIYQSDDSLEKRVHILEEFENFGWSIREPYPVEVWGAVMTSTLNDSLLIASGGVNQFGITTNVNKYVSSTDEWIAASPMYAETVLAGTARVKDFIYVMGGFDFQINAQADMRIYDLTFDSWSLGSPMPTPAGDFAFGVYNDSLIYCIGGIAGLDEELLNVVQIYDPAHDTWTNGTSLPLAGYSMRGGIIGNTILISGGFYDGIGSTARTYLGEINPSDPANITWTQVADYPGGHIGRPAAAPLSTSGLIVFTSGDPTIYTDEYLGVTDNTFAFDLNSMTWKIGPPKPTAANNVSNLAPIVFNDSLYLASRGGMSANGDRIDKNEWINMGRNIVSGIDDKNPDGFSLSNYPNPFAKETSISFDVTQSCKVKVVITDVSGRAIKELCDDQLSAGNHQLRWNSSGLERGVYFCRISAGEKVAVLKLVKCGEN